MKTKFEPLKIEILVMEDADIVTVSIPDTTSDGFYDNNGDHIMGDIFYEN